MMHQEFTSSWLRNPLQKMDWPPCSPDVTPCCFWLLPKLKNALKRLRFADIPDMHCNVTLLLQGILGNNFEDCFRQRQYRLTKCTASQGEYFEGYSSH
jgi:hypothetical protein